jgi:ATP-dependent DNA ligase
VNALAARLGLEAASLCGHALRSGSDLRRGAWLSSWPISRGTRAWTRCGATSGTQRFSSAMQGKACLRSLLPDLLRARSNRLGFRRRQRYLRRMSPRPRSRPLAGIIEPCLPRPADRPPIGGNWLHEIKHDGFRIMARRDAAGVRLLTRNGHDFAGRFPLAAAAVAALPARSCLIDGEAIVTDRNGLAVFDLIRGHRPSAAAVLCAFDLIELDGEDLRREPIETRKSTLRSLLRGKHAGIAFNAHFTSRMAQSSTGRLARSAARALYRSGWDPRTAPAAPTVG